MSVGPAAFCPRADPHPEDSASGRQLSAELARVRLLAQAEVGRFRSAFPEPGDGLQGVFISDRHVDLLLLDGPRASVDISLERRLVAAERDVERLDGLAAATGSARPLDRLCAAFDLDALDRLLFVLVAAPDLDEGMELVVAYLHDNSSARSMTVGLAERLVADRAGRWEVQRRLVPTARLVAGGLVVVHGEGPERSRPLRLDARVLAHLLEAGSELDPATFPGCRLLPCPSGPPAGMGEADDAVVSLRRLWGIGVPSRAFQAAGAAVAVLETGGRDPVDLLDQACRGGGLNRLEIELGRLPSDRDRLDALARALRRELRLTAAVLVLRDGAMLCGPDDRSQALRASLGGLVDEPAGPVALVTDTGSLPRWLPRAQLVRVALPAWTSDQRRRAWVTATAAAGLAVPPDGLDRLAATYRLDSARITRAAALAAGGSLGVLRADEHGNAGADVETVLATAARQQASHGLDELARRVEPRAGWDDIVLPTRTRRQLEEIVAAVRARPGVLDGWGLRRHLWRGVGLVALFSGPSGVGKTLAAEVIAGSLGLDLYALDLATVVDKYVGETEKRLKMVFAQARAADAVLFLDEAEALAGKRSDVTDARDRYANIEVAYLLQQLEAYEGVAILATNLKGSLDDAFTRRIHHTVDFPRPDVAQRRVMWEHLLSTGIPTEEVDLQVVAERFELTGAQITGAVLNAALAARTGDRAVSMLDLVLAVAREDQKQGRFPHSGTFGEWYPAVLSHLGDQRPT